MAQVRLIDYLGFTVGQPNVVQPFPRVIVWGEEFFIANDEDIDSGCESPRYHMTSGYVVTETREHSRF